MTPYLERSLSAAAPRLLVQLGVQADAVPRYDPFRPYGPYGAGPWGMGGWYGRGWGVHGLGRFVWTVKIV